MAKLTQLKSVFVNVYLTDTKYLNVGQNEPSTPATITLATPENPVPAPDNKQVHLYSNQPSVISVPAPALPEINVPATSSESQDRKDTSDSETSAATEIFKCHKGLESVAFISYWSEGHLGWTIYQPKLENHNTSYHSPHQLPEPGGNEPLVLVATQTKGGGKVY